LAEAASRVAGIGVSRVAGETTDRDIGAEAARRAVRAEGDVRLRRPADLVELRPEPTIAVDARPGGLSDVLLSRRPDTRTTFDLQVPSDRQLVVVLQDAHRHDWQREAATNLLAAAPGAIVVEVGLPVWRPDGATGYVATHGAARVNLEAAVDQLLGA
jgi:beta-N-acetylhexosaminidase